MVTKGLQRWYSDDMLFLGDRHVFFAAFPLALGACLSLSACAEDDADSPNHRAGAGGAASTTAGSGGTVPSGEAGSSEAGAAGDPG